MFFSKYAMKNNLQNIHAIYLSSWPVRILILTTDHVQVIFLFVHVVVTYE